MEENLAIQRHRDALQRLLALIFVYVGLADDIASALRSLRGGESGPALAFRAMAEPATVSRRVHRMVQKLLFPVEAATRRLIIVLAVGMPTPKLRPFEIARVRRIPAVTRIRLRRRWTPGVTVPLAVLAPPSKPVFKAPVRPPRFCLLDPLKRFNRRRWVRRDCVPRINMPGFGERRPVPIRRAPTPQDQMSDAGLMRRVAALAHALDDLPAQARRFARWRAFSVRGLTRRLSPLRPGRPPGSPPLRTPQDRMAEQHSALAETHSLARQALDRPDTS
jgi:hypothetical protein